MSTEEKASALLEREHREIDAALRPVLEGAGDRQRLAEALALLRRHIFLEETLVFPRLPQRGLETAVYVMKYEHGEMWPLLEALEAGCRDGTALAALRTPCQSLVTLLRVHNPKEEQVIYTAADELTAQGAGHERQVAELGSAVMPEGWHCEVAPDGALGGQGPGA